MTTYEQVAQQDHLSDKANTDIHCTCCHQNFEHTGHPVEWRYEETNGTVGFGMCGVCNLDSCQCYVAEEVCTPEELALHACKVEGCNTAQCGIG